MGLHSPLARPCASAIGAAFDLRGSQHTQIQASPQPGHASILYLVNAIVRPLAIACLLGSPASSLASDLPIHVSAKEYVVHGSGRPCVVLLAQERIRRLKVMVSRGDRRWTFRIPTLVAGRRRRLCWDDRTGDHRYRVTLRVAGRRSPADEGIELPIRYHPPLRVQLSEQDADLLRRRLSFRVNQLIERAELRIEGATGQLLHQGSQAFAESLAGKVLQVSWPALTSPIARITLTVHRGRAFRRIQLVPWQITIKHEQLHFDTNVWRLAAGQTDKLDRAISNIKAALRKRPSGIGAKLYVAGFADTVGADAHNQRLSRRRARAMARYFHRRGVRLPIYYRGYGERALATATADEADERKNRRAVFVLAAHPPRIARGQALGSWRRFPSGQ